MISAIQLQAICSHAGSRIADFIRPLNDAMSRFSIVTPRRQAAFLAQCAHESVEFRFMRELASGDAYEPPSEKATDLGNTQPGDGRRFKGGGLIQITGRDNYQRCAAALGVDLVNHPEAIEEPDNACAASAWWWQTHGLNELADQNAFGTITHRINGGYNGLDQRLAYWLLALQATQAL
jgi:putative chitinase